MSYFNYPHTDTPVVQPSESIPIYKKNIPDWGPRNQTTNYSAPHLELFYPPRLEPLNTPLEYLNNQGTSNVPTLVPTNTILYRNHWETYNTTSGKVYGGFDPYSLYNIPSYTDRNANYMNIIDSVNPWARAIVDNSGRNFWAYDSHKGKWAQNES